MDNSTNLELQDFVCELRTYLDTLEMLDADISEAGDNPYVKNAAKYTACCELARNLVLEAAKRKLSYLDNFLKYGVKAGEEAEA